MTIIYFLIVIGILVFVHELGHFLMAKKNGVRVEKFSLGMGPKVVGFKKGDTEYVISALPLGGYVKMAGENPDEEPTGAQDEFQEKTVWQRAQIAASGSLMNILLAFMVMPLVFIIGTYEGGAPKVGYVAKDSPAEQAGFQVGDVVQKIGWRRIPSWKRVSMLIMLNPETDLNVTIDRKGEKKTLTLRPTEVSDLKLGYAGLGSDLPFELGKIRPGFPAEKAGIKAHDRIVSLDGKRVSHWNQFAELVNASKGNAVRLRIDRDGKTVRKTVSPVQDKKTGRYIIGVELYEQPPEIQKYGFFQAIALGFQETVWVVDLTFMTLKKLVALKLSIKNLGGPVRIAQFSGQAAEAGLTPFLYLLAIISISLGILNLLPIPVLDGGLLLFLIIEGMRGKPLSRRVMEVSQSVGATVLILFIAVVTYNDVMRVFFGK